MDEIQKTLEIIIQKQNQLQSEFAALVLLLLIISAGVAMYLNDFKNRHTIQNLAKTSYQLVLKQAKKLHKPRKNLGSTETRPDALPMLERFVADYWLKTDPRVMEFTESIWLPVIRQGNFTRGDWKPLTERWKSFGFLVQKDPNAKTGKGTALVVNPLRINGMERKLARIASYSPSPEIGMANMEESA